MDPTAEALAQQAIEAMASRYLARVMERQSEYFEAFLREELSHLVNRVVERVVDQLVERLTAHLPTEPQIARERPERSERSIVALPDPKAAVLQRLRVMQSEGLSLQAMANRLNAEGIPTLSGKGRWRKGTIGNLLAQTEGGQ
jgi:recombinase